MKRILLFIAAFCFFLSASRTQAAGKVTLESLLKQMTDLSLLAEFPDPAYVTKQFSSYDRASITPKDPDGWFANADYAFMLYDGTISEKTPYYRGMPRENIAPDGHFEAGTKVGIARNHKPIGDYVWVYVTAPDGGALRGKIVQGYIKKLAIQMDPQGHVLAEMDGPGCVVRIWSPNPEGAGKIRIYLDNSEKPVIEAPMKDLLEGKWQTEGERGVSTPRWTPFPDPIACERSRGWNLYFPIPYAKHCKITVEKPNIYYHVDYRTYAKGTEVDTFSLNEWSKTDNGSIVDGLKNPQNIRPARQRGPTSYDTIHSGERTKEIRVDGPHIVWLYVRLTDFADVDKTLRGLVLTGHFDDASTPQIWCPLGDFFGTALGFQSKSYRSMPFSLVVDMVRIMEQDATADKKPSLPKPAIKLTANWCMPFEKKAVFQVLNLSKKPVSVYVGLQKSPIQWNEKYMHFHAKWRTETMKTRPFRDWNFCELQGKGVFVGQMLGVMNPSKAWWGEGDEKIYVDDEKFPSWFGTGTEDYFGYGWSDPKPFQHAYHNQTRCDGPGNFGYTSVNRFHILDNIPFTKSFKFDMEVWHWADVTVNYSATSYWYARPGATDNFQPVDAKVLQNIPQPPPPFKIAGAVEGEKLNILAKSSEFDLGPQDMGGFTDGQWSGDSHLWGRPTKKGEWADLELPVPADGKYHVLVYLTKARDYGAVQFLLNGEKLGPHIDGFHPNQVVSTGPIDLGAVDLQKGPATLRVEVIGTNKRSVGLRYMWGLDCVVLKRAK